MSTLSSDGKYNATRRSHFTVAIVPAAMSMHTKCAANPCTPVSPSIPQLIPLTMDRKMKLLHRKRRTRVSLRAVASREHASREYATETINRARDPRPSARSPRPNPSMRCASKTNQRRADRARASDVHVRIHSCVVRNVLRIHHEILSLRLVRRRARRRHGRRARCRIHAPLYAVLCRA